MKRITCEMCGSTDLIKDNGVFICQSCGCKYSVEEAKKLMIEGIVEVCGTVKVDNTDKQENLYKLARRAKEDNNYENAYKYYDMIVMENPTDWEASFYVVYYKALCCKIAEISSATSSINNSLDNIFSLIKNNKSDHEIANIINEIALKCVEAAYLFATSSRNHYNGIDYSIRRQYKTELKNRIIGAINILITFGDLARIEFSENEGVQKSVALVYKNAVIIHKTTKDLYDSIGNSYDYNKDQVLILEKFAKVDVEAEIELNKIHSTLNKHEIESSERLISIWEQKLKSSNGNKFYALGVFFAIFFGVLSIVGLIGMFSGGGFWGFLMFLVCLAFAIYGFCLGKKERDTKNQEALAIRKCLDEEREKLNKLKNKKF